MEPAIRWANERHLIAKYYQLEGIALGLTQNAYLAFDPGLGKTVTALGIVELLNARVTAFCIPASLEGVWLDEIARWCPKAPTVYTLRGVQKLRIQRALFGTIGTKREFFGFDDHDSKDSLQTPCWIILAHETLRVWSEIVLASRQRRGAMLVYEGDVDLALSLAESVSHPRVLVIDELHRFAGYDSKMTQALFTLAGLAGRVIGLSGTPFKGGVPKVWPALKALDPARWPNYWDFIERYCDAQKVQFKEREILVPGNPANAPLEAQKDLRAGIQSVMLRYDRDVVAHLLPEHCKQSVPVNVRPKDAVQIGELVNSLSKALRSYGEARTDSTFLTGEVVRLRVACGKLKVKAALDIAADITGEGKRCIIWNWHREIAQAIHEASKQASFVVDGSLSRGARSQVIDEWARTRGGVLVATYGALGTGLDVLASYCSLQIVCELPWDVDEFKQALGRLDRLSQQATSIHSYLLTLRLPFEESLLNRILDAAEVTDELIGDKRRNFMTGLLGVSMDYSIQDLIKGIKQ